MSENRPMAPLNPRQRHEQAAMTQCLPNSVKMLLASMQDGWPHPEIRQALTNEDRHWISERLRYLHSVIDDPEGQLKIKAALVRMFLVYANVSEDVARLRLKTYQEILAGVDPNAVVLAIERWMRGDVPYPEAMKYPPSTARLRTMALAEPTDVAREIVQLQRLQRAKVAVATPNDPASLEERRAYVERILRGGNAMDNDDPVRKRKAVEI